MLQNVKLINEMAQSLQQGKFVGVVFFVYSLRKVIQNKRTNPSPYRYVQGSRYTGCEHCSSY